MIGLTPGEAHELDRLLAKYERPMDRRRHALPGHIRAVRLQLRRRFAVHRMTFRVLCTGKGREPIVESLLHGAASL